MEQIAQNKKHLHDSVPVIFFNSDSQEWEPVNREDRQSVAAAKHKNQLDEHERLKLYGSNASEEGDLMAARRRRLLAEAEAERKKKSGLPKGLSFFLLIAAVLYALWLFLQR
ncbi:MAG: hypothetical protein FWG42_03715 [Clostridiales bacterium]|nr:hypothetical protein [Clostridiales bacterium]